MHKKGLFAALGVVLATVVASLTLVFTVGPKVSADSYIVLADEEYYDIDEFGVLHGLSQYGREYINNYCWYVNHIYLEIPEGVVQIGNYNNGGGNGRDKVANMSVLPKSLEVTCGGSYDAVEGGPSDYWNGWNVGNYDRIAGVTLPEGLEIIGESVFQSFYNITNITLPEDLQYIGSYAFESCYNLTSIVLPDTVTEIGYAAFQNCSNLTSVKMGDDLEYIDGYAFANCMNLTNVKWSDNLIGIGNNAFGNCQKLKVAKLPDTMQNIADSAFNNCWALSQVKLPNNDQDGCEIGSYAFAGCGSLATIAIPNTITYIGNNAFYACGDNFEINCECLEDDAAVSNWDGDWNYNETYVGNGWNDAYYVPNWNVPFVAPQIVDEIEQNQNQNQNTDTATEVVADETPVNNTGVVAAVAGTAGGAAGLGTMGTIFGIVVGRKRKKL